MANTQDHEMKRDTNVPCRSATPFALIKREMDSAGFEPATSYLPGKRATVTPRAHEADIGSQAIKAYPCPLCDASFSTFEAYEAHTYADKGHAQTLEEAALYLINRLNKEPSGEDAVVVYVQSSAGATPASLGMKPAGEQLLGSFAAIQKLGAPVTANPVETSEHSDFANIVSGSSQVSAPHAYPFTPTVNSGLGEAVQAPMTSSPAITAFYMQGAFYIKILNRDQVSWSIIERLKRIGYSFEMRTGYFVKERYR